LLLPRNSSARNATDTDLLPVVAAKLIASFVFSDAKKFGNWLIMYVLTAVFLFFIFNFKNCGRNGSKNRSLLQVISTSGFVVDFKPAEPKTSRLKIRHAVNCWI
jgi:hypothetical protein